MSDVNVLNSNGFSNTTDLINAANHVGLPLYIAVAFVEKESHGQNIYGHDSGGMFQGMPVTQNNYQTFYEAVVNQHHTSNGVGPMQITWQGFFPEAAKQGIKLWVPYDNFVFGFTLIKSYLNGNYSLASIENAGTRYNGSSTYGKTIVPITVRWHSMLSSNSASLPSGNFPLPSNNWYGINDHTNRSHSGISSSTDASNVRKIQAMVNVTVDGNFGPHTANAVMIWQGNHGCGRDAKVGPLTWNAMVKAA